MWPRAYKALDEAGMVTALEGMRSEQDRNVLAGHMALWGFQDYDTAQVPLLFTHCGAG